ncbi:MAG: hypothetical protein M1822_001954 [Bathelium mastoideum]|nr:MAG: hypothetical protein M1822_001954 [Bathelium mastoideum]
MTTTAAQDEFDALFADKHRPSAHPEDRADDGDSDHSHEHAAIHQSRGRHTSSTAAWYQNQNRRDPDLEDEDDFFDSTEKYDPASINIRNSNMAAAATATYTLPPLFSEANTGPKGVIADAQSYESAKKSHYKRFSFFRNPSDSINLKSKSRSPPPARRHRSASREKGSTSSDDASADDVHDEEGFLARWRQSRLRQLQERQHHRGASSVSQQQQRQERSKSRSKRVWGTLAEVDGAGYLDAVDRVLADTVVVVLVADDASDVSRLVEDCVRVLAAAHATTRFVKLGWEDAEMERAGVPALLAYRGGEKFAGLVPVIEEIPEEEELDVQSLEAAMKRHQIL